MALSERDKERINLMNPVANDLKLGDKLAELEENAGGEIDAYTKKEADAKFQPKGESYTKAESDGKYQAKGTYANKTDLDALAARVKALEDSAGVGS